MAMPFLHTIAKNIRLIQRPPSHEGVHGLFVIPGFMDHSTNTLDPKEIQSIFP